MLKLKPYQEAGVAWLERTPYALLGDDPGLGKSAQALKVAEGRTLIVTPAMLQSVWLGDDGEIAKWRPELDYEWTSYSKLGARVDGKLKPWPRPQFDHRWDTIILDEAHNIKNRKALQTQATLRLLRHDPTRVIMLTGTPVPNWAYELYVLLQVLHPGDRRFTAYWRWIYNWFEVWKPPWGGVKILGLQPGLTWDDFYTGNGLDTKMLRRLRDDVLSDLPPLTEQTISVDMVPAQRKVYNQLKRDYLAWIEETGKEISVWSDGGRSAKLYKLTPGLEAEDPRAHGSGKLDFVRQYVVGLGSSPLVLFCHYRNTAEALVRIGEEAGKRTALIYGGVPQKTRGEIIRRFQAGEIDMLVGTLDTLAEGVTLTRSSICIFIERSWRPSRNEQAMRRLHRIGQKSPVTVIYLETKNSLDQRLMAILKAKTDEQMGVLRARDVAAML